MDAISRSGSPAARQSHRPSLSSGIKSPRSSSRMSTTSSTRHSIAGPSSLSGPASKSSDEESKTAVKVAIRVRPPLQPTDPGFDLIPQRFRASTCEVPSPTNLVITSPQGKKLFVFDRVFEEQVTQEGVWDYLSDSVNSFVQGYNVSILAYGQSGAGKSYTMGTAGDVDSEPAGVIPRAAQALFEKLSASSAPRTGLRSPQRYSTNTLPTVSGMQRAPQGQEKNWKLTATYLEIYNEQLRDLLIPDTVPQGERAQVSIREDTKGRILLTGLTSIPINSVEDLHNALQFGSSIRQTDATAINAISSRSHAVFSLNLVQKKAASAQVRDKRLSVPLEAMANSEQSVIIDSKLHFVDLAGSERLKNTGAQGERAKEGISINAGLASLGKVISQLSSRQPGGYVSYRDSRLTRLLQDSLGGNAITYMVACVTPAEFHLSETLNTVTYAQRARAIQSKPEIQQAHDDKDDPAKLDRLQAEITFLREQIKHDRSSEKRSSTNSDRTGGRRESELQNQLLDMQESYNALSQRHAKLIAEMSKSRDNHEDETATLEDTIGDSAMDRLKRSNSLSQAVEQVVVEYEKTIQSLEASLFNTRSTLSANESTLMERESKIAYMESLAHQLQTRLQKATDREANNDAYLRELEAQIEGATTSEEKSASLIASLRKEITRVKENETNTEEYISTLEEKLAEAEQDQEVMQREMERLEHVIERQRSIGRLDNLMSELDVIRKNEIDAKGSLRSTNGHANDASSSDPFLEPAADIVSRKAEDYKSTDRQEEQHEVAPTGETVPEGVNEAVNQSPDQHSELLASPHEAPRVEEPTKAASRPVSREEQQAAQSNFMADKLETISQELFDLRSEHESTMHEKEELQRKYEMALQTLARLQDDDEDTEEEDDDHNDTHDDNDNEDKREQQNSTDAIRPQSFLGHAGVNLNRIMADGQEPTSSSRSLESELSSLQQAMPTLAEELSMSNNRMSMYTDGGAEERDVATPDPVEVALPEEDPLLIAELESLRERHLDQQERVKELSRSYAQLQQNHHETLGQMESLKAEASRSYNTLRPSSPGMRSPTLRRKLSQDLVSSMTNTDRTTRSFASLRNIALDNFEKNVDLRQSFEINLNTIMSELHERSQRAEVLDAEIQSVRREMEMKQQIISGLTRERSSLQASTGVDLTVVGQMQNQLEQSELRLRAIQETHAEKEKEWQTRVEELKNQLAYHRSAVTDRSNSLAGSADQSKDDTPDHTAHIARLQKELSDREVQHDDALSSMKTSEANLLATIATLEASKTELERSSQDMYARNAEAVSNFDSVRVKHEETVFALEKQLEEHQETVTNLEKQLEEQRSASHSHSEQLVKLERSHSSISQQFDEHAKAKDLTEKELQTHRELVSNLETQLDSHKSTITMHESNLERILNNLKSSHSSEVEKLRRDVVEAEQTASDRYAALVQEHAGAVRSLEEQHNLALASLQEDIERRKEDIEELLHSASTVLGHETDVGRFHSHLSEALATRADGSEWQKKHAQIVVDKEAVDEELQTLRIRSTDLEKQATELMAINTETVQKLEQLKQKELKSSRLVQELEEQITNNFDLHQDTSKRLSAMQERHFQLEEANRAKNEMEKALEDARAKISLLESQLADIRRRSMASTSRESFTHDSISGNSPSFNRDSLSPEAAAIALARTTSAGSMNAPPRPPPTSALPSPPPAIPLPPLPNSPSLGTNSPTFPSSIDARAASPTNTVRSPPGTPQTTYPPSGFSQDGALAAQLDEQASRIRTIEKHLFAEKQLTATLEEALVDLENAQNRSRQDMETWKRRCKDLEDELVGLRKERTNSRVSIHEVEQEREMRVRAERARTALEERMKELNSAGAGVGANGSKKKKKGSLNCF